MTWEKMDPGERLLMRTSSSPFLMEIMYTLTPLANGQARFRIRAKGDPGTFFSLIGPLMNRQVARQIQLDVGTLKEVALDGGRSRTYVSDDGGARGVRAGRRRPATGPPCALQGPSRPHPPPGGAGCPPRP